MFKRTVYLVYYNIKHPRYVNEHEIENETMSRKSAPHFLISMKVGINFVIKANIPKRVESDESSYILNRYYLYAVKCISGESIPTVEYSASLQTAHILHDLK